MKPAAAELLSTLLAHAKTLGADQGDAMMVENTDLTVSRRLRAPEALERSESGAVGLRVFVGNKQAIVSSTDLSRQTLQELAARAVSMAKSATEDADSTLAPEALHAKEVADLDLFDAEEPAETWLMEQAAIAEDTALSAPGITNSEGADASYSAYTVTLATAPAEGKPFTGSYRSSSFSVSVSVIAGEGTSMERDYDYAHARHRADLASAESVGRNAAERALRRLNPQKIVTCQVPVVFDPRVSKGLLGYFAGAISGGSIARGTSFLKNRMGSKLFAEGIRIVDNPHIRRGLGSRPFDGEGMQNAPLTLVEDGVLQHWLLDMRTANRLKLAPNGRAARATSSPPSPSSTNLYMEAGDCSPQELIQDIQNGFYVTEVFGMGVNLVTGDYSQGAAGFWIEKGEITYPVSEITIAGDLSHMFSHATPANDLVFRYVTNCPTLRVEGMTIAGR